MSYGRTLARFATALFGLRQPDEAKLLAHAEGRAGQLGIELGEYVARLTVDADEQRALAGAATNGWTWFWREVDALVEACERLARRGRPGPVRAWVAGCSTGEEVFTLAIVALRAALDVEILGTDVDADRIGRAREARYEDHAMRALPQRVRDGYFVREGGRWRPVDALRCRVRFETHNLLAAPPSPPGGGAWDLICCRNVLLHVEPPAARRMLANLGTALDPLGERVLSAADELGVDDGRVGRRSARADRTISSPPGSAKTAPSTRPGPRGLPALEPTRRESPDRLATVGRADPAEVERKLREVLRRDPERFEAWLTLGNSCMAGHRLREAERAYAAAEALQPRSAEVHLMRGLLYRKRGDVEEAEVAIRRALFLEPDLWLGWMLLAGIYERTGRPRDVARALEAALRGVERRPRLRWRAPSCGVLDREVDAATAERLCWARLGGHPRREMETR
jgi:chemotaxis methyl-accepting protein methylase